MVHRCALAALLILAGAQASAPFENEIKAFEAKDAQSPPAPGAVEFTGSSSIRLWKTLAEDFPEYRVLNRGFGGSQISDSVRYVDRIVTPYKPSAIVFFAGSNDLAAGKSPETVRDDFRAFVEKVRAKLPTVPIAFIGISPAPSRWNNIAKVRQANTLIKAYVDVTPGLQFIDVYPLMVNAIGGPRPEIFGPDNLHMNAKGYAIWKVEVDKALHEMVPPAGN